MYMAPKWYTFVISKSIVETALLTGLPGLFSVSHGQKGVCLWMFSDNQGAET